MSASTIIDGAKMPKVYVMETISLEPDLRGIFKWIMRMEGEQRLTQLCLSFPNIEAGTLVEVHLGTLTATITKRDGKYTFRTDETDEVDEDRDEEGVPHASFGYEHSAMYGDD